MKPTTIAAWVITALGASHLSFAQPTSTHLAYASHQYDIASQPISDALNAYAAQSGLQVVIDWADAGETRSARISGEFTALLALDKLLSGTGLTYQLLNDNTVAVRAKSDSKVEDSATLNHPAPESGPVLEEVLVTAEKRSETLQETPVPVSVINADSLANSSRVLIRDYFTDVPGLSVAPVTIQQALSIRGISTGGFTNPTVGVIVDDVPFGSPINYEAGNLVPDLDPGDLARIEVLRGPQGTLYGANSMGGLIKFVTKDPSTDAYSGRAEVGTYNVYNGTEPGFDAGLGQHSG